MFILSHSVTVSRREVLFLFIFNLPSSIFILSHGYLSWSLFLFILLSSFPCMFISSINLFSFCSSITHSLPVSRREVFIRFVLLFSVLYVYLFTSSIFILFIYHTQCLDMILFRFILLFSVLYVYLFTSSIAYLFVCFDAQIASLRSIHHLTSLDLSYGNCKTLSLFLLYLSVSSSSCFLYSLSLYFSLYHLSLYLCVIFLIFLNLPVFSLSLPILSFIFVFVHYLLCLYYLSISLCLIFLSHFFLFDNVLPLYVILVRTDTPHHISISLCLRVSLSSTSLRSFDTVQKYKSTSSLLSTFVYHLSFFLFLSLSFSPHLPPLHSSSCLSAATHSSKANQCKLCVCLTHHVRVQFELVGFDC